jgi:hypothetical protein
MSNPNPDAARFRRGELRMLIGLVSLGVLSGAAGAAVAQRYGQPELFKILAEATATLLFGSLLGGALSLIVTDFDRRRLQRVAQLEFFTNVLRDLQDVYDRVDRGRTLIRAHKSAKTYGEEMKDFIAARVKLLNVKRALEFDERGMSISGIRKYVAEMEAYLSGLIGEFEQEYKDISRSQSLYEARMKSSVEAVARRTAAEPSGSVADAPALLPANEPWDRIAHLPVVNDFPSAQGGYSTQFLDSLDAASQQLRNAITRRIIGESRSQ